HAANLPSPFTKKVNPSFDVPVGTRFENKEPMPLENISIVKSPRPRLTLSVDLSSALLNRLLLSPLIGDSTEKVTPLLLHNLPVSSVKLSLKYSSDITALK